VVLRVMDAHLDRPLAVKLMLRTQADPAQQERFLAEARVTGRLQHPGVPPVHEVGRLADGRPFFSMKLVAGRTLADLLRARAAPADDLLRYLKIFEQICQTMAYAHALGVIHRDLKPLNVMVGAFGEVQVMDWGLAKEIKGWKSARPPDKPAGADGRQRPPRDEDTRQPAAEVATLDWFADESEERTTAWTAQMPEGRTTDGQVLGTLAYMPPEQANARLDQIDARADVFGLGALLCEILTGKPPYTARKMVELLGQARAGDLGDARARLAGCGADAALIDLAKSYLAPDPAERPAHAGVVAEQVTAYLNSVQERLRQAEVERAAAQARAGAERTKRRWQLALAGVLGVALLAGGGGGLWDGRGQGARGQRPERVAARMEERLDAPTRHAG